jgi:hypothetical protein
LPGAVVGQVLSAVAVSAGAGVTPSVPAGALADPADVLADGVVLWELHAASVMTDDSAQATSATEAFIRKEFTVVTLHPHHAFLASSPRT